MSHPPHPPPVANPLVRVLTGSGVDAVEREKARRRSSNAGLQRGAEDAMKTLADCAPRAFTRYNGDNNLTPTLGTPLDEV